ncbi:MAG: hypothetical protein JWO78_668 [Micavibrio sp.]|nr:hypothetical protein [Micavibrio sp.]
MSESLGLTPAASQGLAAVADMVGQPAANFANSGGAYTLGVDTGASSFGDGGGLGGAVAGIATAIGAALGGGSPGGDGGPSPE